MTSGRRVNPRVVLNERQRYEHVMSGARERLGAAYQTEHRAGAGLTLEQAVAAARLHVPALERTEMHLPALDQRREKSNQTD